SLYEEMSSKRPPEKGKPDYRPYVKMAVPFMVGDSYNGHRIVGTSPLMFGYTDDGEPVEGQPFEYRKGRHYEMAAGKVFGPRKFEAVIGSNVAAAEHMTVGSTFRATHGLPRGNERPDVHKPVWTVVGVLKPTHTANDN